VASDNWLEVFKWLKYQEASVLPSFQIMSWAGPSGISVSFSHAGFFMISAMSIGVEFLWE
jgi:hypothetical protein